MRAVSNTIAPSYLLVETSVATWQAIDGIQAEWQQAGAAAAQNQPGIDPRMGILSFSAGIEQVLPLSTLTPMDNFPAMRAGAGADVGADGFRYLRDLISHDLNWLKGQGATVLRPVLHLVAASAPSNDAWAPGLTEFLDPEFSYRPNIVAYCLTPAAAPLVNAVSPSRLLMATGSDADTSFGLAVHAAFGLALETARSGQLSIPSELPGFRATAA